jgi:hypothetical protein
LAATWDVADLCAEVHSYAANVMTAWTKVLLARSAIANESMAHFGVRQ